MDENKKIKKTRLQSKPFGEYSDVGGESIVVPDSNSHKMQYICPFFKKQKTTKAFEEYGA